MMKALVAVDSNWGIGYKGDLLQKIPEDMKFFRSITTNNIVVMGRKTLESLPEGKPLKNRINVVLTRNKNYKCDGAIICHSAEELFETLAKEEFSNLTVYLIGGGNVFGHLLSSCSEALVTKIRKSYEADTFFKNLDQDENWELAEEGEVKAYNDIEFNFNTYVNKAYSK
jgi:dihydrofolate reductase